MQEHDSTSNTRSTRLSKKVPTVMALLETGVSDAAAIAKAVGLPVEDVERIDAERDIHARSRAIEEFPRDTYYHLRSKIICPGCGSTIYLVPCVACNIAKSLRSHRV